MLTGSFSDHAIEPVVMIPFNPIHDDAPVLRHAPLLRAALMTFDYIDANGPIGLTASKGLKRYFVEWAAEMFAWPHYAVEDLYAINKVLNEGDFPPLVILHDVLLGTKLVRHYKGKLCITKSGQALRQQPATLWAVLANYFLCELDHAPYTRFEERLSGDWGVLLNILNIEAQTGVSDNAFAALVMGMTEEGLMLDYHLRPLFYVHVLRPLAWVGLLAEHRDGSARLFTKTPLWTAALTLETDEFLQPVTKH